MKHFDADLLRTLVAFADSGTLRHAAEIVGRTPSAVTAQMQRLEAAAGVALLAATGRRRELTPAGHRLVVHARRILEANQEAWLSVAGAEAAGSVGLGLTEDFSDAALSDVLNRFARTHPGVQINLRVGRTVDLAGDYVSGRLDILIALRRTVEADEITVFREPMIWLSGRHSLSLPGSGPGSDTLPLAVLEAPCSFRDAALRSLDALDTRYRIAVSSLTLAGLSASVRAGIAVTVRTPRWLHDGIGPAPERLGLPALPDAEFSIRVHEGAEPPAQRLAAAIADSLTSGTARDTT